MSHLAIEEPVRLHNEIPEVEQTDDLVLVDNSQALEVTAEGAVRLPLLDASEGVDVSQSNLNPDAPTFVDASQMDINELSHFYANDQSLRSLHSQSLSEDPEAPETRTYAKRAPVPIPPVTSYSKRKVSTSTSPPHNPAAKRTQSSPSKSVSESLVDICLRPTRVLRSRGPAPHVPNIPFPAEYRSYRRELEKLEAQQDAADPTQPQDVAVPEALPPS